jgi:hypothetical protein
MSSADSYRKFAAELKAKTATEPSIMSDPSVTAREAEGKAEAVRDAEPNGLGSRLPRAGETWRRK